MGLYEHNITSHDNHVFVSARVYHEASGLLIIGQSPSVVCRIAGLDIASTADSAQPNRAHCQVLVNPINLGSPLSTKILILPTFLVRIF